LPAAFSGADLRETRYARTCANTTTSFPNWQQLCLKAGKAYPSKEKLVGALAKRVEMLLDRKGSMLPM
tara:strand:+ start:635 stop:838 length:204 start_codon:yes stop_codon:yes gene_type:complete